MKPLFVFVSFFCFITGFAQAGKGKIYQKAAVVCAHPEAARVGEDVLRRGGNAVDAAFAVHFALAVVYPSAGNLGGGGFALYRSGHGDYDFLDFREKAPAKASRDMFLDGNRNPVKGKSTHTHAASGVPGSVAGIFGLHRKYGSMDRMELLSYAVQLAEKGFPITELQADDFNGYADEFKSRNPHNNYLQKTSKWQAGDTLIQKDLGRTLSEIRYLGEEGFYSRRTANLIIAEMKRGGGLISLSDLKNYKPVWRTPIVGSYRGHKIVSAPPPSSGGIALLQMLKLAERFDFKSFGLKSVEDVFYTTEIERLAYADRSKFVGDPDFFDIPSDSLLSDRYSIQRAALIRPFLPNPSDSILPGGFAVKEKEYTTHFSIMDSMGNAVSLTTTINDHYGSKIFVAGAGFLLNNEMDDFSIKSGVANMYGLTGTEANAISPNKRMLSSMTPTMVEKDGKLLMILGTPGGSTIITTVFRLVLNVIDQGLGMNEAIGILRFHHQWLPDIISHEKDAFTPEMQEKLKKLGYVLKERGYIGRADCILVKPDGTIEAAPDPRGDDAAGGW
jgi:gamma-glutamyltranspeptidase/glutathione hydrolase